MKEMLDLESIKENCEKLFGGKFVEGEKEGWSKGWLMDVDLNGIEIDGLKLNQLNLQKQMSGEGYVVYIGNKDEYSMNMLDAISDKTFVIINDFDVYVGVQLLGMWVMKQNKYTYYYRRERSFES